MNPILLTDYYKTEHYRMYPDGTTMIYSNFTPRKSRFPQIKGVVVFGIQAFIKKFLIDKFNKDFFQRPIEEVLAEYSMAINTSTEHIKALHSLGYLPIQIKALPEGSICPIGVPCLTIRNTHPEFGWLTNYLETLISCELWQPITSATIANEYRKLLTKYALATTGSDDFVQWQGHDFSMRGMSSLDSAIGSGMAHLTSFTGTDTIPAIYAIKKYYGSTELIGASVPATEHSVMCMGTKDGELETFENLLKKYPNGILSVVSDTWDLWEVCTSILPTLKDKILARDGKLVIRPDSGDPVKILTGYTWSEITPCQDLDRSVTRYEVKETGKFISERERKGVVELLWDVFGGTTKIINGHEYKTLDSHIGAIYGDSITLERAEQICDRLQVKGFASTNVVFGIGSYTYQYNTRDTFGFAMKATYGEVEVNPQTLPEPAQSMQLNAQMWKSGTPIVESREIFKAPVTDDGTKKSAKGLLQVYQTSTGYKLKDQCTWEEENTGALSLIFINGQLIRETNFDSIRTRLKSSS